jgi:hypothetical protein
MQTRELIMDLTDEQGSSRESQVQPPSQVWEQFFGVRVSAALRPTYRLQNKRTPSDPEQRKVVKHHHNLTIEIGDAKPPRPAILRMRRTGNNAFDYWVYRSPSAAYRHCNWILTNMADEASRGRRWIII